MANSSKKLHTRHAACDDPGPDVPQTRTTTQSAAVGSGNSSVFKTSLRGPMVYLIAILCSLAMVTPRNRPIPFRDPTSDAVDHVNP